MTLGRKILTRCLIALMVVASVATAADLPNVEIKRSKRSFKQYYGNRYAVCVGINNYQGLPNLNCAVSDALEMAAVFEAYGFDRVILLTDEEASRKAIFGAVKEIESVATDEDLFVFFFAGHGMTLRNGTDLRGVLVPADCAKGQEAEAGIPMESLKEMTDGMPNRHSLFLMDACYAGYGVSESKGSSSRSSNKLSDSAIAKLVSNPSVQVITAGGELDRAFEADGHGLFTRYLLECLKGDSPESRDGVVSGKELASRVRSMVREETGGWQTPQFASLGSGDVVFTMGRTIPSSAVAMAN